MNSDYLNTILQYDRDTGVFKWKVKKSKNTIVGSEAGSNHSKGYLTVYIDGKNYFLHRLAWMMEYGEFPKHTIDHINHNRKDNRIKNLRSVSYSKNNKNLSMRKSNNSGFTGVYWKKDRSKWIASITVDGVGISLGSYINIEDAINARKEANVKYGFHENHGKMFKRI